MHVNSVLLAELEAHPGAAHTKTDAVAHSGDVSHKIPTSEIPMPLGVEVPGICQQVHEGMMLGNNSKAVPLLFQAPGMQPCVGQQELFSKFMSFSKLCWGEEGVRSIPEGHQLFQARCCSQHLLLLLKPAGTKELFQDWHQSRQEMLGFPCL